MKTRVLRTWTNLEFSNWVFRIIEKINILWGIYNKNNKISNLNKKNTKWQQIENKNKKTILKHNVRLFTPIFNTLRFWNRRKGECCSPSETVNFAWNLSQCDWPRRALIQRDFFIPLANHASNKLLLKYSENRWIWTARAIKAYHSRPYGCPCNNKHFTEIKKPNLEGYIPQWINQLALGKPNWYLHSG